MPVTLVEGPATLSAEDSAEISRFVEKLLRELAEREGKDE